MAAVLEKQAKRWTYEEYYRLDDEQRYEIIDGTLLMAPAPDPANKSLEILRLNESRYQLHGSAEIKGKLTSGPGGTGV